MSQVSERHPGCGVPRTDETCLHPYEGVVARERVAPLQAMQTVPRARTDELKLIWQLNPGDLQGAELLHQFQMRGFLSMLQGVPVGGTRAAGRRGIRDPASGNGQNLYTALPTVL